jgi:hypothetical protein
MRNFRQNFADKIKTRALCSVNYFRTSSRLWDNVINCGRARQTAVDSIMLRLRFACRITKAIIQTHTHTHTPTHRSCNTYCISTATVVTLTRLTVKLYVHCLSCLVYINIKRASLIANHSTAALSDRKFVSAVTSLDSCGARVRGKGYTVCYKLRAVCLELKA